MLLLLHKQLCPTRLAFFADKPTKPDIMLPDKNIAIAGKNFTIKCVADGLPKPCKL